jgi:ubiquitin-like domain-containing CTD phosphatase 1
LRRLLVLDLDYTLLDCKAYSENSLSAVGKHYAGTEGLGSDDPKDYARPGLHAFLTAVYPYYDIVIWSQTAWRWLESKLIELEMVGGVNESHYNISFGEPSLP